MTDGFGSPSADLVALAEPSPSAAAAPAEEERVPGEGGLWLLILGDMTVFAGFFIAFFVYRAAEPVTFAESRASLVTGIGAANTIILVTSSLFVALAVRAHRENDLGGARRQVALAGLCAAAFAVLKSVEWAIELDRGHGPSENLFFAFYFMVTGLHFLHLLVGGAVLAYWRRGMLHPERWRDDRLVVESCASYWHMVDLLWILIFPIIYLTAT